MVSMKELLQEGPSSALIGEHLMDEHPGTETNVVFSDTQNGEAEAVTVDSETACDYLGALFTNSESYETPKSLQNLPDPKEVQVEEFKTGAGTGDELAYEVNVEGQKDVGNGPIAYDGNGREYICGKDGTTVLGSVEITFSQEAASEHVDEAERDAYEEVVEMYAEE